jgi:hypothetical protein
LIVVPRPMPAASRRYLTVVHRPLPAAPLVDHRRYLIVVPRTKPAAPRRYLVVVHRPIPAAARRYLIVEPGCYPRLRTLCVTDTWPWCPGRSPRRRSLCIAELCSFILVLRPLPAAAIVLR